MMKNYTIAVAGTGYAGLSIATLLAQHHRVVAVIASGRGYQAGRGHAVHGYEGGGSGEAVCQYVSGAACVVLQFMLEKPFI